MQSCSTLVRITRSPHHDAAEWSRPSAYGLLVLISYFISSSSNVYEYLPFVPGMTEGWSTFNNDMV